MWSIFDARTSVTLVALLLAMCTGVVGLLLLSRRPTPGAAEWGFGLLLYVASTMLLLIRQPRFDWLPLNIGIGLAVLTCMLVLNGIHRWNGLTPSRRTLIFVPLTTLLVLNIVRVSLAPGHMDLAVSPAFTSVILGYAAGQAWRSPGLEFCSRLLAVLAVVQVVRVGMYLIPPEPLLQIILLLTLAALVMVQGIALYRAVARRTEALNERS
ncbi:hypothetical protein ACFSM5_02285 [Lacibacterium aquatile]|uniref:Uncharacterized protein n=1 Tax=Lacibacterium aquatile TaxID=1168082 RepID=A0ABW5DKR2_9PROT